MTDIKLLRLAAKAAGLGLPAEKDTDEIGRQYEDGLGLWVKFPWGWDWFSPLNNDGDALRLSVRLNLTVHKGFAYTPTGRLFDSRDRINFYAATRRAIVRAAAEIGRNMK